jgi:phosphoesterase RecJ-like protein
MTLDDLAAYFQAHDDFVVVSHEGPDADGIGAAYALVIALESIGKRAAAVVPDALPPKFRFIDRRGLFMSLAAGDLPFSPRVIVIVDTHDLSYVGARVEALLGTAEGRVLIDHHEQKTDCIEPALLDPAASSSCELVYLLAKRLGAVLPEDAAEAVFAGIVYDTGSFAYPKTGERTFACALELVQQGVKPYVVHNRMYESSSIGVLILQKTVFSSLELHSENRIAVQTLLRADLAASGASYEDAEDLVNTPLQGRTIEVSILFKENLEGKLRCSLRSKGHMNVAHIAQSFGGGGHKTAAGFTCQYPLERVKGDVLQTIGRALRECPAGGT